VANHTIRLDCDSYFDSVGVSASLDLQAQDYHLLEGLREGSDRAYEQLVLQYQTPVYNLVARLLNDPTETADVVQEVFLKVFRSVGSFRGQSSLKTWIYRIAVNEAHNQRRWFTRHKRQEVGLEAEEEGLPSYSECLSDHGRSPYDIAVGAETHQLIEEALAQLNPTFRTAVILRDIEDLSYEEIAEVLQISLGTVKSRILRGREALRKILTERLEMAPTMQLTPQHAD
jgi:RNA polymerase sigma factor, sigma-70 family